MLHSTRRELVSRNFEETRKTMRLGRQSSTRVSTEAEPPLSTNGCGCVSVYRVKLSNWLKIWDILPQHMRQRKCGWNKKYGGKCQALTLRMEELDAFKPIRDGNQKDLEGLAELLDNCCQSNRRQRRSRIGKRFTVHHYPTEA